MSDQTATSVFRPGPIGLAWLLGVGVDLFFNAGVFTGLFDQSREPSLLADEALFRRIPIAYLALAVGMLGLAWLVERLGIDRPLTGTAVGGMVGLMFALMGVVNLWTAVELTGLFVAGAVLVQVTQFAVAGSLLERYKGRVETKGLARGAIASFLALVAAGVVAQNLIGG